MGKSPRYQSLHRLGKAEEMALVNAGSRHQAGVESEFLMVCCAPGYGHLQEKIAIFGFNGRSLNTAVLVLCSQRLGQSLSKKYQELS